MNECGAEKQLKQQEKGGGATEGRQKWAHESHLPSDRWSYLAQDDSNEDMNLLISLLLSSVFVLCWILTKLQMLTNSTKMLSGGIFKVKSQTHLINMSDRIRR